MKMLRLLALAALVGAALVAVGGCTDMSSRAILTVQSVNDGNVYYSDLVSDSGTVVADQAVVTFGNIQMDGGQPLDPGTPYSDIIVTGYTVTYDNGVYPPVSGGMTIHVPSGGSAEATIILSNLASKASLSDTYVTSTTARLVFTGFVQANGGNNGDAVRAIANLPIQVANFKDDDIPN